MLNNILFTGLGIDITISRVLFSVFGIDIYAYGAIIALGFILAFWYGTKEADRVGLGQDDLLNMFLIAVPLAIVGARLYYVIFSWSDYKNNLSEIFNIRNGGLAVYGGVIAAVLVVFVYCRKKKISMGLVLDILCIGLLIGQSIGRWGNFFNGEAFGSQTSLPWAMTIISDGQTIAQNVHPTFFYESLWNALGVIVLTLYKKKKSFNGELFCGYMIWYGFGRMLIEGLRTDSLYIGAFRVSQLLSLALVVAGIVIIIINKKRRIK